MKIQSFIPHSSCVHSYHHQPCVSVNNQPGWFYHLKDFKQFYRGRDMLSGKSDWTSHCGSCCRFRSKTGHRCWRFTHRRSCRRARYTTNLLQKAKREFLDESACLNFIISGLGVMGADVSGHHLPCENQPITSRMAVICGTSSCHMAVSFTSEKRIYADV